MIARQGQQQRRRGAAAALVPVESSPDVTGVTYQSASRGQVAATVAAGRFALWLPGNELMDASRTGVQVQVTYRDGSTATRRLDLR